MVGIFDSGVGGLSVWRELIKILPSERYLYISDSSNCPYGPKCKKDLINRTAILAKYLIEAGAEIIVVACNTATAAAIKELRAGYPIPFVGMEPAIKPATIESQTGIIGVLATKGTFKGELYIGTSDRYARAKSIKIIERVGEGLVELVESGRADSPEAEHLVREYVEPMMEAGADCLVLGCTHYPFLIDTIKKVVGDNLKIINPAPAVARQVVRVLKEERQKQICGFKEMRGIENIMATTGENVDLLKTMAERIIDDVATEGILSSKQLSALRHTQYLSLKI